MGQLGEVGHSAASQQMEVARRVEQPDLCGQAETMNTLIGVATSRQKALEAFQELRHAFAPDQFLAFVQKLDVSTSGYVNAGSVPSSSRARLE